MEVEFYLGDAGYQTLEFEAKEVMFCKAKDILELYKNLEEVEKRKIIVANGTDIKEAIKEVLLSLDVNEANKIAKQLSEEFLSLDGWHSRLKAINK
ncbi:hypothetical protein [uncultured Campylobacter sp.]|uniref:hypothetical protein n=1 Tax=uncultured Campylobacter sp. TaxID=218934 RepID=UPI00261E3B14|nr:hypothetical protein [uncultured Campylobacter sp.]